MALKERPGDSESITATGWAEGCAELLALEENWQRCPTALWPLWAEAAPSLRTCSVPAVSTFATCFQPALKQHLPTPGLLTAQAPKGLMGQREDSHLQRGPSPAC